MYFRNSELTNHHLRWKRSFLLLPFQPILNLAIHCVFSISQVQLSLYTYLSAEFIGTATIYSTIRRVGTVLQLMHTLKYYYWASNPLESSGITPKGLGEFSNTHILPVFTSIYGSFILHVILFNCAV